MRCRGRTQRFDLVLTSETLEHVPDPRLALRETLRVLRPGGRHVFTVPLESAARRRVRAKGCQPSTMAVAVGRSRSSPARPTCSPTPTSGATSASFSARRASSSERSRGSRDRLRRRDALAAVDSRRAERARSRASAGRTARFSPRCFSTRGTTWPASSAVRPRRTRRRLPRSRGASSSSRRTCSTTRRSPALSRDAAPNEVYNLAAPSFVPALVGRAGSHGRVRRGRRDVDARGDPRGRSRDPLLPGVLERDLRRAARDAADGGDGAAPADAVRRREGVRPLHRRELPAPLRDVHVLRDPLQPRVAAAAGRLPAAQGRARRGGDLARAREASSCSATSLRAATGATRATTSARCG